MEPAKWGARGQGWEDGRDGRERERIQREKTEHILTLDCSQQLYKPVRLDRKAAPPTPKKALKRERRETMR